MSMIDRMLRKDCSKCIIVITQENFPRRAKLPILSDFYSPLKRTYFVLRTKNVLQSHSLWDHNHSLILNLLQSDFPLSPPWKCFLIPNQGLPGIEREVRVPEF